jgi:hypothetical protein
LLRLLCRRRWALQQRRSVSDETRMDKCTAPSFGTFLLCSLFPHAIQEASGPFP